MAGRKVKYMGTSDVCRLDAGEDWSGRLAEPLKRKVVWNKDNRWVIDTEEADLSDEAVALLLEDKDRFKDVTDLKTIPTNAHQRTFMGMGAREDEELPASDNPNLVAGGEAEHSGSATPAPVAPPARAGRGGAAAGGGAAT